MNTCPCGTPFSLVTFSPILRPELCASCWLALQPTRDTIMNLKKTTSPGQCAAMRCTEKTNADDATTIDGVAPVELCGRHYGQAISDHGLAFVVRAGGAPGPAPAAVVDSNEPEALALEGAESVALASSFTIASADDLAFAVEALTETKARAKYVAERKDAITRPLNEALKAARALFKPAEERFAEVEKIFKDAIATFHTMQAEHNARALATAAEAAAAGDTAATSEALETMARTEDAAGISMRYTFGYEISDANAVERQYCAPNSALIREYMRDAIEECRKADVPEELITSLIVIPGVTFTRTAGVAVRS